MQIINSKTIRQTSLIFLFFIIFIFSQCTKSDCEVSDCKLNLDDEATIIVTSNVSGAKGTQITPDILDENSITESTAEIKFSVLRIGLCHEVVGYGHTWSSTNATPRIGSDEFVDYETNINFNDEVITKMNNLNSNTKYWVRSWIAIEIQDCNLEREIYYNDKITDFQTK